MSATEATAVPAPAEEVKVVETPAVEPAPEAPAAEQAAPATVIFFHLPFVPPDSNHIYTQEAPKEEVKAEVTCSHRCLLFVG
jgi:hypothetical protein